MSAELDRFKIQLSGVDLFGEVADDDGQLMEIANGNQQYHDQWDRVNADLQRLEGTERLAFAEDKELAEILDILIPQALQATPNASLVGDILDDLVLVARAARVHYVDTWLDAIWTEYRAGRFPRVQ